MKVRWWGYGGNHWMAEKYRDILTDIGIKLETCHEYENADFKYNKDTVHEFIRDADVIILPYREKQPAKSVNRLGQAWSLGKACIIWPLPSYLDYAVDGENCIIVRDDNEFLTQVKRLKDNPELIRKLGEKGRETAFKNLHPRDYIKRYMLSLKKSKKHVHVVIPHYSPTLEYIDLAVESVFNQKGVSCSLAVSSSSKVKPNYVGANGVPTVVYHQEARMSFAEAINKGMSLAPEETTHYLIFNDDAILSEYCLKNMLESLGDEKALMNPYSNCDKGWLHNDSLKIIKDDKILDMYPGMSLNQVEYFLEAIKTYNPASNQKQKIETPFCAFYCTLIPKQVWDDVGLINMGFSNGGEDADYCYRAHKLGYKTYWNKSSFCFHFGGKSRKVSQDEDPHRHEIEDNFNNNLLRQRWPKNKKRIAIWTGPAFEKWDLDSPYSTGIGGSETCAVHLSRYLAEQGHHVTMFGDHEDKEQYGVHLKPWTSYNPKEEYWDLFIASRNIAPINDDLKAKNILVWVHDIWLLSGQHIPQKVRDKVTKFICLSPWHKEFFKNHHGVTDDEIYIIGNGVDTSIYEGTNIEEKVYGKMHYSSSPDRGLDNLLTCLPYIADHIPEVHVDVYYGFFNWKSAIEQRGDDYNKRRLEIIENLIEQCKDRVNFMDRVNQKELAQRWKKAYVWGYPTLFTETYCITAKEAQLTRTPIVTSNVAALETTVSPDHGIFIGSDAYGSQARQKFIDEVVKLHKNKDYWLEWSEKSYLGSKGITWKDRIDEHWSKFL